MEQGINRLHLLPMLTLEFTPHRATPQRPASRTPPRAALADHANHRVPVNSDRPTATHAPYRAPPETANYPYRVPP